MLSISEQRKVFEKFCTERYGENGCQTSKTISREKGQKIIRLLQNDPADEALGTQSRDSENAQHNLKIAQIPRLHGTYITLHQTLGRKALHFSFSELIITQV